jgi:hypothetical protein
LNQELVTLQAAIPGEWGAIVMLSGTEPDAVLKVTKADHPLSSGARLPQPCVASHLTGHHPLATPHLLQGFAKGLSSGHVEAVLWERSGRVSHPRSLLHELDFFGSLGFGVYLVGVEQDEAGNTSPGPLLHLTDATYQGTAHHHNLSHIHTHTHTHTHTRIGGTSSLRWECDKKCADVGYAACCSQAYLSQRRRGLLSHSSPSALRGKSRPTRHSSTEIDGDRIGINLIKQRNNMR